MRTVRRIFALLVPQLLASTALLLCGCEIDSAESSSRNVGLDVTGYYSGALAGKLVERNSGAPITGIDLRQNGDRIEGYDNNGKIFRGTIGQVSGKQASFTLEGVTTSGAAGVISGSISVDGTSATMSGTWFEEALSSRVAGNASVQEPQSNLAISPASATISSNGNTRSFTASGGDGSYTWSLNDTSRGSISGSGASVEYTRSSSGSNTITVSSGGDSASATISQP